MYSLYWQQTIIHNYQQVENFYRTNLCLCSEHKYLIKNQPHILMKYYEPFRKKVDKIIYRDISPTMNYTEYFPTVYEPQLPRVWKVLYIGYLMKNKPQPFPTDYKSSSTVLNRDIYNRIYNINNQTHLKSPKNLLTTAYKGTGRNIYRISYKEPTTDFPTVY